MKAQTLPPNVYRHGSRFRGQMVRNGKRLRSPLCLSPEEAVEWLVRNASPDAWKELPRASRHWRSMVADLLRMWADGRISATDHEATDLLDEFSRKQALGVEK